MILFSDNVVQKRHCCFIKLLLAIFFSPPKYDSLNNHPKVEYSETSFAWQRNENSSKHDRAFCHVLSACSDKNTAL